MPWTLQNVETTSPCNAQHTTKETANVNLEKPQADDAAPKETEQGCELSSSTPHLERLVHLRQSHEITLLCAGETTRLMAVALYLVAKPKGLGHPLIPGLQKYGPFAKVAATLAPRMQALVMMLDEWQIFWRLFGSLDVWFALKALLKEVRQRVTLEERIDWALETGQTLSMACYYVFEGIGWLGYWKALSSSSEHQAKMYRWSSWGWCGGMLFDNARGMVDWRRRERVGEAGSEWKSNLRKVFIRNTAWALVAANLGVEDGFLPDLLSAGLGTYASVSEITDLWKDT